MVRRLIKNSGLLRPLVATADSSSARAAAEPHSRGATVTTHAVLIDVGSSPNSTRHVPLVDLIPTQVEALMHLINNETSKGDRMTGKTFSSQWIIDTGAPHYVTYDLTCFTHVTSIVECPVGLPDDTRALATMEGHVTLTDGLTLSHVFYVPQLNCKFISVSQLIDDSNCHFKFTWFSAIQDQRSRTLIGEGEPRDGLYFFIAFLLCKR